MGTAAMIDRSQLDSMDAAGLRGAVLTLLEKIDRDSREISFKDAKIAKLTFEMAYLKRIQYGPLSEKLTGEQKELFDEAIASDLAAIEQNLADLKAKVKLPVAAEKQKPKRLPLPSDFPRVEHHHEPESTVCTCGCTLKRIGEDVSEKLDYAPGDFSVERHIRGKWACKACETLIQAPVAPDVIDKGIPTAGLLAQVIVAKYADHLPMYRQEQIFGRAGLAIPRSTLSSWAGACGAKLQPLVDLLKQELLAGNVLQADETPVSMLAPGTGKTHRSYLWAYVSGEFEPLKAVVYDFTDSRSGEHARKFLGNWKGSLVCDDFSGYKACFDKGITEVGCMAHARRHFINLHQANQSTIAADAIEYIRQLYRIEAQVKHLDPGQRLEYRQRLSLPIADALQAWLIAQRFRVPDGSATAKAINYSLNRWEALTRFLDDPALPIDNNLDERQIRPWATGRKNWLFAGTLLSGQRAAAIMSLIQSAKLNGHDPYLYMKDVLKRLPTQKGSELHLLLPHRWILAK
jgi:transposase